jgi:hypothetical protein
MKEEETGTEAVAATIATSVNSARRTRTLHLAFCILRSAFFLFHFFLYTFNPIFLSSAPGMLTFPSVEAMMIVLPDDDGPNSLVRSTLMVRRFP